MNIPVTGASEYILSFLGDHRHGFVHSVYRKTINLSFDGQLASLQAADSPLSPISLLTPLTGGEMAALPVAAGMPVTASSKTLQVGEKLTFFLDRASLFDLQLTRSLPAEKLIHLEKRLHGLLASHNAGSFELFYSDPDGALKIPFLAAAKKHLACASHAMSSFCWEEAAAELGGLIGLGLGLTPGGDDFLCGVLAGLIFCGSSGHPFSLALREYIGRHLDDTNAVSAAFLECALKGQFSRAVNSLLLIPSPEEILAAFTAIGHSSGTDTLCGITYLLENRSLLSDYFHKKQ